MLAQLHGPQGPLAGRWHLVAADTPAAAVPGHRVDLIFHEDAQGLRGALLSRVSGAEWPLRALAFDGTELRLQMGLPPDAGIDVEPPFLVMRRAGDHFEGGWDVPGAEHIRLKLVREV